MQTVPVKNPQNDILRENKSPSWTHSRSMRDDGGCLILIILRLEL